MGKSLPLLGSLAFAGAGGLIGGLFTAGTFSSTGASIGMMVGGMLFAQPQQTPASSVADLKVTVAEPAFLPIICGDDMPDLQDLLQTLPGGVWLPGKIVKVPQKGGISTKKKKSKKRGGTAGRLYGAPAGGDVQQFLSCAYAWCEGSLEHPGKLKEFRFDDKIHFRDGAAPNQEGYIERTFVYDALGNEVGWTSDTIHHFYGTQTQPADDVLSSWYDGEGGPALRGTCYTVVTGVEITSFGHVPNAYARIGNGVSDRREQCRFFLQRANGLDGEGAFPLSAIRLSKISGHSRGWFMTQPGAPRTIAELIASRSFCSLVEHSYAIWDVDLANPTIHDLENWELGARLQSGSDDGGDGGAPRFKRGRGGSAPLASRVEVRYADARKRDENTVSAVLPTALQENVMTFELPTVDVEEEVQAWAQVTLDAAHVSRVTGEVATLPRRLNVLPGDVIRVPRLALEEPVVTNTRARELVTLLVRERTLGLPGPLELSGVGWSGHVYRNVPRIVPPPAPVEGDVFAPPLLFVANTVALDGEALAQGGVIVAASQKAGLKWDKGAYVEVDVAREGGGWDEVDGYEMPDRATMGQLLAPWVAQSAYDGYLSGNPLEVEMFWGALTTAPAGAVRGGANALLLENGLVVSFSTALQTGLTAWNEGRYELDGLKSGRWGSDAIVTPGTFVPQGTRFVLLTDETGQRSDAIRFDGQDAKRLGRLHRLRAWMQGKRNLEEQRGFTFRALNMMPLAPSGVRASMDATGALHLSGRGRTRDPRADGWNTASLAATEPRRAAGYGYAVTLTANGQSRTQTLYTPDDGASFSWTWSASDLAALFGGTPTNLTGDVAMLGNYGAGFSTLWNTI